MLHELGHDERWWDDVEVGDHLPERVFGPYAIASFATEWRSSLFTTWSTLDRREIDSAALGFTPEVAGHENDPHMERINPELTSVSSISACRGLMARVLRWEHK